MRGSVLFNEDEVKHAGQQQSKKHTQLQRNTRKASPKMKLMIRSPVQHTDRSTLGSRPRRPPNKNADPPQRPPSGLGAEPIPRFLFLAPHCQRDIGEMVTALSHLFLA